MTTTTLQRLLSLNSTNSNNFVLLMIVHQTQDHSVDLSIVQSLLVSRQRHSMLRCWIFVQMSAPTYSINKHLLKYQEEAEVSSLPSRVSQPSGDAYSPGDNVCVPMCVYKVRGSSGQRVTEPFWD